MLFLPGSRRFGKLWDAVRQQKLAPPADLKLKSEAMCCPSWSTFTTLLRRPCPIFVMNCPLPLPLLPWTSQILMQRHCMRNVLTQIFQRPSPNNGKRRVRSRSICLELPRPLKNDGCRLVRWRSTMSSMSCRADWRNPAHFLPFGGLLVIQKSTEHFLKQDFMHPTRFP